MFTIRGAFKKVATTIPIYSHLLKLKRQVSAWNKALSTYKKQNGKPDIIHLNALYPVAIIGIYLKLKWKVPLIVTEQWTGYFGADGRYKGFFKKHVTKTAVRLAQTVTVISTDLRDIMLEHGLKKQYQLITNTVDINTFKINEKSNNGSFGSVHVSFLNDEQKNVSGIIRASSRLLKKSPPVILTIVGEGIDKPELQKLREQLDISGSVKFTVRKTGAGLAYILQNSRVFVLFSNYETQAVVLLEAMCCGIPVIATRVGGVSENLNANNGILIEPGNEEQLQHAMHYMILNPNLYNPAVVKETAVNKVSGATIAKHFMKIYQKAIE